MESSTYPHVAFVGLGAMGFAMSTHLVRQGFPLTGYDICEPTLSRWQFTCNDIPNSRATTARSPAEAVKSTTVICLMVANHHHVHSALFDSESGAIHGLRRNSTVIVHATIPPTQPTEIRQRLTSEFNRPDVKLVDAPVSGGTARSINGTLTIMASSDEQSNILEPSVKLVLDALSTKGSTLYPIPGGLGSGESAKALNQVMCGIHIVSASEIMGLAALNGLDTQIFYDTLNSPTSSAQNHRGWSWMFSNRGPRMLAAIPPLASATAIIAKDVGIIRDEETRLSIDLPLLNTASEVLARVNAIDSAADDSIIVQHYLGLETPRRDLVVKQAGKSYRGAEAQKIGVEALAMAHSIIHFNSAFETVKFAQALELMGEQQMKMWFGIISGAAGGSTTFNEVIPPVLLNGKRTEVEHGFRDYAFEKFSAEDLVQATKIVSDAKEQGYEPVMLEQAVGFLSELRRQ